MDGEEVRDRRPGPRIDAVLVVAPTVEHVAAAATDRVYHYSELLGHLFEMLVNELLMSRIAIQEQVRPRRSR